LDEEHQQGEQAAGEVRNSWQASGQRQTQCAYENVDTVESLLLSQEDKPQSHRTVREISREAEGSIDHQFRGLFTKTYVSSATRKGALNSWLKRTACTRYFRYMQF